MTTLEQAHQRLRPKLVASSINGRMKRYIGVRNNSEHTLNQAGAENLGRQLGIPIVAGDKIIRAPETIIVDYPDGDIMGWRIATIGGQPVVIDPKNPHTYTAKVPIDADWLI